jgi:4-amino-4-deoxy-L-arabinose transferase-like glycosyltransferase
MRRLSRASALGVLGLALGVRLAFVLWVPGAPTGDGFVYVLYAHSIERGDGYTNLDGSPGILWMPGWPAYMAALYSVFGPGGRVVLISNALLGAATALLVAALGARWFGRRIGVVAGVLYAIWPGIVYYAGTFFTETTFNFLLASTLLLLTAAARATVWRSAWFAAAGLCFGLCAMVKAEPLALSPVVLLFLWTVCRSRSEFLRTAVVTFAATAAVILPWSIRNYVVFDRIIPTSVNGGFVAHIGNHHGATGGGDFVFATWYWGQHERPTAAEANIALNTAGWRDTWKFVRENPGEELRILGRKIRLTYLGDDQGAKLVRGVGGEEAWSISRAAWIRLRTIANVYWFAVLSLAALGVGTARGWPREARVLLFGIVATWFLLHLVFLGGTRFHVPETLAYALFAACGIDRLANVARRRIARGAEARAQDPGPISPGTRRGRAT